MNPKLGYTYGSYDRKGLSNTDYEGKIERRTAALSNELRRPIKFGNIQFSPTAEFNLAVYQTNLKENKKQYSLSMKDYQTYSAELGFGAHLSTKKAFSKTKAFNFMGSITLYHEFADPYELKLSMNEMDGHFKIRDEKRKNDYVVLRSKLSYDVDNMSFYGGLLSYIDSEARSRIDLGFKYAF